MAPLNRRALSSLIWFASLINVQALYITGPIPGFNLKFPKINSDKSSRLSSWDTQLLGDKSFAYAYCDGYGGKTKSVNCDVVLARFDNQGLVSNQSCNVNIGHKEGEGLQFLQVHSSHNDRVVLVYPNFYEGPSEGIANASAVHVKLRLAVIHMSDCQRYETEVATESPAPRTSYYLYLDIFHHDNDTFDVLVPYAACDGARCKYTFNDKARRISGPLAFLPAEYRDSNVRVYPFESSNAYYALVTGGPTPGNYEDVPSTTVTVSQKLLYVRDGIASQVANFSMELYSHLTSHNDRVHFHRSDDLFGFCRQHTVNAVKLVDCAQFDENNNRRINVTLRLKDSRDVLAVYNAPKGLLFVEATRGEDQFFRGFSIRKIATDNTVKVDYLEMNDPVLVQYAIAQSDADEFCISMYGLAKPEEIMMLTKKCLPNSITFLYTSTE